MFQTSSMQPTLSFDAEAAVCAAQAILDRRLWCAIETCVDVARQVWEPRLMIMCEDPAATAEEIVPWARCMPGEDLRIAGYTRDTLRRVEDAPQALCYVAGHTVLPAESEIVLRGAE